MSNISNKVLTEIKEKHITPIPKWQLLLKDTFVWTLSGMGLVLGSFSIAIVIHQMTSPDYAPIQNFSELISYIPYFWILMMIVFLFVAYHNFVHTKRGYRYRTATILSASLGASVLLGIILAGSGFGSGLNMFFAKNIPYYSQYADMRSYVWMNPSEGRLAGKLTSVSPDKNTFVLQDLNGSTWEVSYESSTVRPSVTLEIGTMIKILGKMSGKGQFSAKEIRPWMGNGNMMQGNEREMRTTQ